MPAGPSGGPTRAAGAIPARTAEAEAEAEADEDAPAERRGPPHVCGLVVHCRSKREHGRVHAAASHRSAGEPLGQGGGRQGGGFVDLRVEGRTVPHLFVVLLGPAGETGRGYEQVQLGVSQGRSGRNPMSSSPTILRVMSSSAQKGSQHADQFAGETITPGRRQPRRARNGGVFTTS